MDRHLASSTLPLNSRGRMNRTFADWDPIGEMLQMQEEMDQLLNSSFSQMGASFVFDSLNTSSSFSPQIEIEDLGKSYVISISVPGSDKSSITTEIKNGMLYISGETNLSSENESNQQNGNVVHREQFFGSFNKSFSLPSDIDENTAQTDYKDGIVTITIAKIR